MPSDSFSLETGYPIYAAAFPSDTKLVVAGGGGEGKNGTVLDVDTTLQTIKLVQEKILSKDEDSPTSLDITETGVMAIGINAGSETIKTGSNPHLRLFKLENDNRIEPISSNQLFPTGQADEYQKCTRFSREGALLAIASSTGTLHTLAFPSLQPQFPPVDVSDGETSGDIQDVDFSYNEKLLAYTTSKSVTLLSAVTGEKIGEYYPPPASSFRGVRFAAHDTLILIANHARREGASMLKLTLPSDIYLTKQQSQPPIRAVRSLHTGIKAVTALACRETIACIAGADLSVSIVRVDTLREIKIFRNAHTFPVTQVVINPSATAAASTSVAQSVVVVSIEGTTDANNKRIMIVSTIISVFVIVIVGILVQLVVQRQVLQKYIDFKRDQNYVH